MAKCGECGTDVDTGDGYCRGCGKPLSGQTIEPDPSRKERPSTYQIPPSPASPLRAILTAIRTEVIPWTLGFVGFLALLVITGNGIWLLGMFACTVGAVVSLARSAEPKA